MKIKPTIQFRPDAPLAEVFFSAVDELGVSDSELARRAIAEGLATAKRKIIQEKTAEARGILERFKDSTSSMRRTALWSKSSTVFA